MLWIIIFCNDFFLAKRCLETAGVSFGAVGDDSDFLFDQVALVDEFPSIWRKTLSMSDLCLQLVGTDDIDFI